MVIRRKLVIALCVFAGMATAGLCEYHHVAHDHHTADHFHDDHDSHHDSHSQPGDCENHDEAPHHHHHCLQLPVADRPAVDHYAFAVFHVDLMKIPAEISLIPDEPVFSLDKPPLI
jgi:hypothetical protein